MVATIIISLILAAVVAYIVYNRFFNKAKKGAGCAKCADAGCPLYDQVQMLKQNNQKKA